MKMKNNLLKWSFFLFVFTFVGCETIDLDQIENPSQPSVDLLDPVYAFNYIQLQLPDFVNSANTFTQRVTRQMAMSSGNTYDNAFAPVDSNTNWNIGYNLLNAVKIMEPKAITNREFYALGAAKVIRVYVLMTMVDVYGDIPYSEALQGSANLNPKFDRSADIYKGLLLELDDAIAVLGQTNNSNSEIQDLYYGSQANWITLAKTLKLKMYCNARLAGAELGVTISDKVNEILVANDYIDQQSEDFQFQYGNSRFTPNTRHPMYNDQYELGGGAYIANYMMWAMTTEKKFENIKETELFAMVFITTNEPQALEIEHGDRRFTIYTTGDNIEKVKFFGCNTHDNLKVAIKSELMDFAHMLNNYEVDVKLATTAQNTPEKDALVGATTDRFHQFYVALLKKDIDYFEDLKITNAPLYGILVNSFKTNLLSKKQLKDFFNYLEGEDISSKKLLTKLRTIDAFFFDDKKNSKGSEDGDRHYYLNSDYNPYNINIA